MIATPSPALYMDGAFSCRHENGRPDSGLPPPKAVTPPPQVAGAACVRG